jgi:mRNA interferase HigB
MRVVSKTILREFWKKHKDSEQQLKAWHKEVTKAKWSNPSELKAEYPKASILKNGRVVFDICRNSYRLVVKIHFNRKSIYIRFIGTHNDYDKINANLI